MIKNVTRAAVPARSNARARTRRVATPTSLNKRVKTTFAVLLLLVETAVALVLVCALAVFWNFSAELSSFESIISDSHEPVSTKIWSEDGVLLGKLDMENRQPITLEELGKARVIDATVAIEDHRFYEHPGVDVVGIARAALANLRGSTVRQGASTLTQQLVRQPGIGTQFGLNNERRFSRKVREGLVALRVEQLYSKPEILQLYLNNVYYGAGAYGVQAAAKTYFHKSASQLTLSQAALVAGLPQSPSELSPFRHRKAAIRRRDEVLDAMLEYGKITKIQHDDAKHETVTLAKPPKRNQMGFKAPYFTTYVLHELTKNYASDMVYSGLSIRTTLNWRIQQAAEHALRHGLANASGFGANQGAIVCLDPQSGYIRAMVGGRDFHASQYNAATQGRRQPGSTFKVFDYTAAFDTGLCGLDDAFIDRPIPYPNDPKHLVQNYGGGYSYKGITCRTAIMFSKNTIAVQVAQKVGIKTVIDYAYKMGISTPLAPYLPTALGASAVRPIDLCSAYSIFASKGVRYHPMAVTRVTDADGNVLDASRYAPQKEVDILKPETINQIDEALQGVVTSGTGTLARGDESTGIVEAARGKTGTTNDNRDAWFAGYTPNLTTVVWLASVHKRGKRLVYSEMPGATGGHQAAPIWHDFMIQAVPIQHKYNALAQRWNLPAPRTVATTIEPEKPKRRKATTPKPETPANDTTLTSAPDPGEDPPTASDPGDTAPETQDPETETDPAPIVPSPSGTTTRSAPAALPSRPTVAPPTVSAPHVSVPAYPSTERRPGSASVFRTAPPSTGRIRATQPPVRVAPPQARVAPPEALIAVSVCGDSGDIANPYCDTYKTVHVSASQAARMRRCRLHRAPPGEGR
jgi:penicillin-binding protein 1A